MKWFLITMAALLVTALLIVVGVYVWVTYLMESGAEAVPAEFFQKTASSTNGEGQIDGDIPLKNLPISEAQADALRFAGIEIDTFVITPVMQECAKEKLGDDRFAEVMAGDVPSTIETISLITCL